MQYGVFPFEKILELGQRIAHELQEYPHRKDAPELVAEVALAAGGKLIDQFVSNSPNARLHVIHGTR